MILTRVKGEEGLLVVSVAPSIPFQLSLAEIPDRKTDGSANLYSFRRSARRDFISTLGPRSIVSRTTDKLGTRAVGIGMVINILALNSVLRDQCLGVQWLQGLPLIYK
jgi:hypothetical protein